MNAKIKEKNLNNLNKLNNNLYIKKMALKTNYLILNKLFSNQELSIYLKIQKHEKSLNNNKRQIKNLKNKIVKKMTSNNKSRFKRVATCFNDFKCKGGKVCAKANQTKNWCKKLNKQKKNKENNEKKVIKEKENLYKIVKKNIETKIDNDTADTKEINLLNTIDNRNKSYVAVNKKINKILKKSSMKTKYIKIINKQKNCNNIKCSPNQTCTKFFQSKNVKNKLKKANISGLNTNKVCETLKKDYKDRIKKRNKLIKSQDVLLDYYIDENTNSDGTPITTDPNIGGGAGNTIGSIF